MPIVSLAAVSGLALVLAWQNHSQSRAIDGLETQIAELAESRILRTKIVILGLDEMLGQPGEYFLFDSSPLDQIFGDGWVGQSHAAVLARSGKFAEVRLWRRKRAASLGYGRATSDSINVRWREGEVLLVLGSPAASQAD